MTTEPDRFDLIEAYADDAPADHSKRQPIPVIVDAPAPTAPAIDPAFCSCDPRPYRARRDANGRATTTPVCSVCFKPDRPRSSTPARVASDNATPTALVDVASEAAAVAAAIPAVRGVVGLTAADVNPIANMATPAAQAAVSYFEGDVREAQYARLRIRNGTATAADRALVERIDRQHATDRAETANVATAITAGQLVAGAAVGGTGMILAWSGSGGLTRGAILETLTEANAPAEWAPRVPAASTHLGQTMGKINGRGRVVRSVPGVRGDGIVSKWVIGTIDPNATAGSNMGPVSLTVTLRSDSDALQIDGADAELAGEIRRDYTARVAAVQYTSAQVSEWLTSILRRHNAEPMGGWSIFYVPAAHVAVIEALVLPLARRFGNWMQPLPVATSEQLKAGLVRTFGGEVEELVAEVDAAVAAVEPGKQLKSVSAAAFQRKLRALAERVIHYAAMLGDHHIAPIRAAIDRALASLDASLDDGAVRFEMIADELRREGVQV